MNTEHEMNILTGGVRILKNLKNEFKEKKNIENEMKKGNSFLKELASMEQDGEISYQELLDYSEEIGRQLNLNEIELITLKKKISLEIECINGINQSIIANNIRVPLKWYRLIGKVQTDIQNFMLDGDFQTYKPESLDPKDKEEQTK